MANNESVEKCIEEKRKIGFSIPVSEKLCETCEETYNV
jgi:hypothetical protein